MTEKPKRGKPPVALGLALASLAATVGGVGLVQQHVSCQPLNPPGVDASGTIAVHDKSPEGAAESYLDAWRKRRFDTAAQLAVGPARTQARNRLKHAAATPGQPTPERLRFAADETFFDSPSQIRLFGVAEGQLGKPPYRQEVSFTVRKQDRGWRVEEMSLGAVLADPDAGPSGAGSGSYD